MSTPNPLERIGLRIAQAMGLAPPDPPALPTAYADPRSYPSTPETARRVLERRGVLPQQAAEDTARSRRMFEAVTPFAYGSNQTAADGSSQMREPRVIRALLGREQVEARAVLDDTAGLFRMRPDLRQPGLEHIWAAGARREDAWRTYLGLPQEHNTFSVSRYRPTISHDNNATYYSIPEWLSAHAKYFHMSEPETVRTMLSIMRGHSSSGQPERIWNDAGGGVMGNYTMTEGRDAIGPYISYYDRWDLGESYLEGTQGRTGKPFEIYDRIYYDQWNYTPLTEQQIAARREDLVHRREVRESFRNLTKRR